MNEMIRNPQWPAQGSIKDPVKQIFDRLFEGSLFQNATDESSVVTSQWVPRVDIKEEADRFLLYADIPGVDPQDIEVSTAEVLGKTSPADAIYESEWSPDVHVMPASSRLQAREHGKP